MKAGKRVKRATGEAEAQQSANFRKPARTAKRRSASVGKPGRPAARLATQQAEVGAGSRDEVVRRRIIRAAAEIYRECGYERAGMTAIAQRLGMTAPALYWYFASKEEILAAFLEHTIADLIRFVRSLLRSTEPRQRLWEFMYAYVLWQLQQQELSAAYERIYALGHLRNSLPEKQRARVKSLEREFYRICRDLVVDLHGRAVRPGEIAPIAFAMIGMVEHLISWFRPSGAMSVNQIATQYADLTVAMAAAGRSRGESPAKRKQKIT